MPPHPPPRKFRMADLMILVAGCSAGIAWTRAYLGDIVRWSPYWMQESWRESIQEILRATTPCLASLGLALLACRLRPPRPSIRRIARQPGTAALACSALVMAAEAAILLAARALKPALDRLLPLDPSFLTTPRQPLGLALATSIFEMTGPAVAIGWFGLLVGGRWRPEPTWIDRAGRCLGISWIALYVNSGLLWSW